MDVRHPFNQVIATTLMAVMLVNPILVRAAELALDAAAGGNASIGQATNGVPLVNINTPSASGLSHNKFTDYNVGQQGLILNNSAQALTPTQLGGYIVGNPNLQGGSARLILNEVTGGNASRLAGYTEVAGQAAHVVVANPHGITCDGCGFINTPRATLATGTPQIDNGALKGYDVNGGKIAIEGPGLNAGNVGQFELITRAAEINAEIHAQQLTIVTGRNEVDAQTLAATAKADSGSAKPSVAIDSSALGGMYAGAIRLVGTEAGVGVRLAGDLAASGGDIRIDANGQLSMARSAAAGDLAVNAQKVILEGDTFAAGSASIETGQLDVQQSLAAGNRVEVTAQTLNNPGTIEAGVRADGSRNAAAQLQLSGDAVNNSGKLISHGSLQTDLKTLSNSGEIAVAGNAQIKAERLDNSGQLIAQQDLAIEAVQTHNQSTLGAAGTVRIDSTTLSNEHGLLFSGADMTLRSEQVTNRQGDILSLGSLDLAADDQGARSQSLENISGTIESTGDMQLAVDHLLNRKERFAATQQLVEGHISILGTDNCKGDHCEAAYLVEERYTPQISEDSAAPMLVAGGDLAFVGERFENRLGSVSAGGKIQVDADQFFNVGAGGGRERIADYYIYTSNDYAYWTFINNLALYNAYNDPESPSYDPQAMSFESMMLGVQRGGGWIDTSGEALVNAVVQAGGTVAINASQTLENAVIRPDGSGGAHLNRQLPPDLAQRLVDPLALPGYGLPAGTGGLFRLNTDPGHRYLIESNPAFASLGGFLSSDYMLGLLGYTDETTQRRLGDGLYEQRLIREAIIARTGKRFLVDALASDEAQFRYLMDNALASKEALNLSVGIALSAEQVAALTHDIVWLEEREVSGEKVLVPVLYMAQANDRLAPNGALIQGSDLALISGGALHNSGTLRGANLDLQAMSIANRGLAQADDRLSLLAMGDVRNSQGGILTGEKVGVTSLFGDVVNERSVASNTGQNGGFTWRDDVVDSAARIEAGSELLIDAGRDLRNTGGAISSGGDAGLYASRDIRLDAASETDSRQMLFKRAAMSNRQVTQHGGEVTVAGNLDAWAGRDLSVVASQAQAQGDIDLYANRDLTLSAAANERESDFFRKGSSKKVTTSSMAIDQQGALVEAGGALNLGAGNDLALVGSRAKAGGDVALTAGQNVQILAAQDESDSYYYKKSKGSFGRSKSVERASYDSTNVASVIEAGKDLSINTSKGADGSLGLEGGRDVVVMGSKLKAGNDLLVGGLGNVSVISGIEQNSSFYEQKKSGSFSLSKSGKSQTSASSSQIASELAAGNDVVVLAGNDVNFLASNVNAGNDAELHAGLVTGAGDINLAAANDTAYSRAEAYKKKIGLSGGDFAGLMLGSPSWGGDIDLAASKKSGSETQSSISVGSQIIAERDVTLIAERDINVIGSGVSAGRNALLDADRDVRIVAGSSSQQTSSWENTKTVGMQQDMDDNGYTTFVGEEKLKRKALTAQQTAAGSLIDAGLDIDIRAGRDIVQLGSDLDAGYDLNVQAGRNIVIDAVGERSVVGSSKSQERDGSTTKVNHNFGNLKDALGGAGDGDDAVSQVSSILKAADTINQFFGGPTADMHAGKSSQSQSLTQTTESNRASILSAGNDIFLQANEGIAVRGSQFEAGRDINVKAKDVTFGVADGALSNESQQTQGKGGILGGTTGGFKIGIGSSRGTANQHSSQGTVSAAYLDAGRDINLEASNDLSLVGTQAQSGRDINLKAGNDLLIGAAGNNLVVDEKRRSAGGEVGLTVGSDGFGVYVSASLGRGNLEREGTQQQEAYLYAGRDLNFQSGRDTAIAGAELEGENIHGQVGRNLKVSSVPDTGKVTGKEYDASATVTIGYGVSVSGSVGYGETSGATDWVGRQTSVIARDRLQIRTEEHTQIDGAIIASNTGNLVIDTNTLGFRDIHGKDNESGYYLNGGGSYGGGQQDASQVGKGDEGVSGWSLEGYEYNRERRQIVRATVGSGEIIVRNDEATGNDSTSGLNRDVSLASVVTKDSEGRTDLYISKSSIEMAINPVATLERWQRDVEEFPQKNLEAVKQARQLVDGIGNAAQTIWREIEALQVSSEDVPSNLKAVFTDEQALAITKSMVRNGLSPEAAALLDANNLQALLWFAGKAEAFDLAMAECQASGACKVDSTDWKGSSIVGENGELNILVITGKARTSGETALLEVAKLKTYVDALPAEEAQLVMFGAQALMGPFKAMVGFAGNTILGSIFGAQIENAKEEIAAIIADPLVSQSEKDLLISHQQYKELFQAGESESNGDLYVIGSKFVLDIALGSVAGLGSKAVTNKRRVDVNERSPVFKTNKEAKVAAESWGYRKINETVHGGQPVYVKDGTYITRDLDGHNGGAWKMATSVKRLESKSTRLGTFDADFKRIGD